MSLVYAIKEGLAGFKRARVAAIGSTITMIVALMLIGSWGLLVYNAYHVAELLKQRVGEIEIFLEEVDEPIAKAMLRRAEATIGVAQATYITKTQAHQIFIQEFGEGGEIFLDNNFLPASIKVRLELNYANPDSLSEIAHQFRGWARVSEVVFNRPILLMVQQNLELGMIAGISIGILVLLAAVFLVGYTIRLTIYARRLLIRTMKLVGATDKFVRRPFLVEGIAQGMLAGLLASAGVWGASIGAVKLLPQLEGIIQWPLDTPFIALSGLLVLGMMLGWLASSIAVRRFLRKTALN